MTTFTTADRQDAQREPLTNEEVKQVWDSIKWNGFEPIELTFARAIERAHGIGEMYDTSN